MHILWATVHRHKKIDHFNAHIWSNIWSIYRRNCSTANRLIFRQSEFVDIPFQCVRHSRIENARYKLSEQKREYDWRSLLVQSGEYKINLNAQTTRRRMTTEAEARRTRKKEQQSRSTLQLPNDGIVCFCSIRYSLLAKRREQKKWIPHQCAHRVCVKRFRRFSISHKLISTRMKWNSVGVLRSQSGKAFVE